MAKLNKSTAALKARQSAQIRNGCSVKGSYSKALDSSGKFNTPYELGCKAWQNAVPFSSSWHPHFKQGWTKERDRDIAFANSCPAARARVLYRLSLISPESLVA